MTDALRNIFKKLGLDKDKGLFITKDNLWQKETTLPNRVRRLIERKIKPDAFFCFDNKPLILFFNNPSNKSILHKTIWNFNESPMAIIVENDVIEIYNGFNYLKGKKRLEKLGGNEKLNDFTYFKLVTGKTWEQYEDKLNYKNRIDYYLLDNIKTARKSLVEKYKLDAKIANAVIGKSIFVRYLIDRKVRIKFESKPRMWTNDEFCELLNNPNKVKLFFDYLEDKDRGFNGDLFPLSDDEYKKITKKHYQVISRLLQGEEIEEKQLSFFEFYDFSIIPIEFISNVYELFIGEENQKKAGAYYTPLFLVDYILKETVENFLNKKKSGFECKVLDPACGSGIFLVETLRKIIEKYKTDSGVDPRSEEFKETLKKLTLENIYGIDKDISAVQVAIFSVYLTLLDYLEPPSIERFTFPELFNKNFFEADFFDENSQYNNYFNGIDFNFILGNPPWKGSGMDVIGKEYLKNRKKREYKLKKKFKVAINNNEVVEGFVLRVSDFCRKDTQVAFIIRSSSLYNLGYNDKYSPFRQYWLEEYFVDKVFELAPVRHEVFEKSNQPSVAPAAVLFYRYANGKNTDNNILEHLALKQNRFFTLFKIFTINRTDYKKLSQRKLKDYDWLWKVLVYGSYLDFNFIKRLKEEYNSIKNIISEKNKFIASTGLHSRSESLKEPKDTTLIEDIPFLKTEAVKSFYIEYDHTDILKKDKIDIIKDVRIYHHPMLLVREGISMKTLTAKCAISKKDVLFKGSIAAIKALNKINLNVLNNIAAIFSTHLFSYYAVNTFASIGIERERVENYNKYSLPYLELDVKENIDKIEKANEGIYLENRQTRIDSVKINRLQEQIQEELSRINTSIYKKLELNNVEIALIEYALKINLKLIVGNDGAKNDLFSPLAMYDDILKDYATLFVKRFKTKLDTNEKKFTVEIWHTKQIVGMFFKMIPASKYVKSITWINKQNSDFEILSLLSSISAEKITDSLFVRKDLRGFEKKNFYIFKPNEKRLWHQAIGYLDVNDFAEAILKAAGKGK